MVLYLISASCVLGYLVLAVLPTAYDWFPRSAALTAGGWKFFSRIQILSSFGVLAFLLAGRFSWGWLGLFASVYAVGLAAEYASVQMGFPFGRFVHTGLLGYRILGRVPWLIPLAWFNIAVPALAIASMAFPERDRRLGRIFLGSFLMLAWDLSIDPVMAHLHPFWIWAERGAYYGIPASNFAGWFLVGLVMTALPEWPGLGLRFSFSDDRPLIAHYGASLLAPLGTAAVAGMWLPPFLTLSSAVVGLLLLRRGVGSAQPEPVQDFAKGFKLAESRRCGSLSR